MPKRVWLCVLLILSVFVLGVWNIPISQADVLNKLTDDQAQMPTIRVGYPLQSGLTEKNENGEYSGYTYEYLRKMAQFTGWDLKFVEVGGTLNEQLTNILAMLQNGEVDLVGGIAYNNLTKDQYAFPENDYGMSFSTLSVLENNTKINQANILFLPSLSVAVRRTAINRIALLEAFCQNNHIALTKVLCDTEEEVILALKSGQAETALGVDLSPIKGTRKVAKFGGKSFYLVTKLGNTKLLQELNTAIMELKRLDPYLETELYEKYFVEDEKFYLSPEEIEFVQHSPNIRVMIDREIPPFQQFRQGVYSGISVSLLKDIMKKTGLNFQFYEGKSELSLQENIERLSIDCVLGVRYDNSYAKKNDLFLSQPYLTTETTLFSRRKVNLDDTSLMRLGLVVGEKILPQIKYKEIKYYSNLEECLRAVDEKDVDFGYGNSYQVPYEMTQHFYPNLTSLQVPIANQSYCFGFCKPVTMELVTLMNRVVSTLNKDDIQNFFLQELAEASYRITFKDYLYLHSTQFILVVIGLSLLFVLLSLFILNTRKKRQVLEGQNEAKQRFLAQMSHEMRTPLSVILGLNDLQMESCDQAQVVLDYSKKIRSATVHLLGIINDILDLSKINEGKMVLHDRSFNLLAMLQETEMVYRENAQFNHLTLETNFILPIDFEVIGDELRLKQVIINLLSNAVKYNKPDGKIILSSKLVSVSDSAIVALVEVQDTGIGIGEQNRALIFKAFERVNETEATDGTGLGLAISSEIVRLMKGTLTVQSELGVGSIFSLTVPLGKGEKIQANVEPVKRSQDFTLSGKRILVAEDKAINAFIVKKMLEKLEARVDIVENGQMALDLFEQSAAHTYDCILMDIRMPVMDGLESSRRIRALDREDASTVIIIALSANAFQEDKDKSVDAGMNEHLSKPIMANALYDTLNKCLIQSS